MWRSSTQSKILFARACAGFGVALLASVGLTSQTALAAQATATTVGSAAHATARPHTFVPVSGYTVPDPPTSAQVNTATAEGAGYVDCQQDQTSGDPNIGSFNADVPETAAAIIAYGVLDKGDFASLPTAVADASCPGTDRNYQADLTAAVSWMLGQQDTSTPSLMGTGGSWSFEGGYQTYSTGLALTALGLSPTIPGLTTEIVGAVALGRAFLADEQQTEPNPSVVGQTNCTTTANTPAGEDDSYYCGGWNYGPGNDFRSDQSNTGYAVTGLRLTGGLTATEQKYLAGWENNDQADSATNPYWADGGATECGTAVPHNDGGAAYQPDAVPLGGYCWSADFSSNANDSGTLLFSQADAGLTMSDPRVDAAVQFDTDVLDTYEKTANSLPNEGGPHTMVYHDGASEDGSCVAGEGGCDWGLGTFEGGFHYSMFTLAKGLGAYIAPNLADGTNWYSKIADLLLHQQNTSPACTPHQGTACMFGSWPADLRDDFSTLFSTALSVFALGLVATPPPPVGSVTSVTKSPVCTQVSFSWTNPTTQNYGGVYIQRNTTGYPASATSGTRVADVLSPGTTYTDTGLVSGKTYYYALFAHDTTGQAVAGGVDERVTPICTGYRLAASDGGVFAFGESFLGSCPHSGGTCTTLAAPIVGMATPVNGGYLLVGSDGGVFAFGGAGFYGSLPERHISVRDIVGIAPTADGRGYWLVGSDGGIFGFGDAVFHGSCPQAGTACHNLSAPIVGIASPDTGGYWLVGGDGGIFTFGNAVFHGSCPQAGTACHNLSAPIVGIASADAGGYWLVGRDGGVFTFGNAVFHGSCPQTGSACHVLRAPIVGISSPGTGGYWLAGADGGVFAFDLAPFLGSCPESGSGCQTLAKPIVAIN
jgi:hypothetical protein